MDSIESFLEHITRRCHLALKTRPALPFYSLQYRLCEVGPRRLDPRDLREALTQLTSMGSLSEHRSGIYSNPEDGLLSQASNHVIKTVGKLTTTIGDEGFNHLVKGINSQIGTQTLGEVSRQRPREIIPSAEITTRDTIVIYPRPQTSPVHIWISFDPEWIFPNDDRLWKFFLECTTHNAHPIVFARKIAPSTFPLFKALGILGLQYYVWLGSDTVTKKFQLEVDKAGFPPVRSATSLIENPAFNLLATAIRGRSEEDLTETFRQAIVNADSYGLTRPETATLATLQSWAATNPEIPLADAWHAGLAQMVRTDRLEIVSFHKPSRSKAAGTTPKGNESFPEEERIHGFGRKTTVTRVPFTLR